MQVKVIIFKGEKTATQSGYSKNDKWYLEYAPSSSTTINPIMGWNSSTDTYKQVKIKFNFLEDAIAYATNLGLSYEVLPPHSKKILPKSYADNFQ